jgi:hypothetical protein
LSGNSFAKLPNAMRLGLIGAGGRSVFANATMPDPGEPFDHLSCDGASSSGGHAHCDGRLLRATALIEKWVGCDRSKGV